MEITRKSLFTGKVRTRDLDITEEQMKAYEEGELLQRAFPNLSADDREFIKTGVTQEEWDHFIPDEEVI